VQDAWRELADVPSRFAPAVVTIGNFDGVHLGHQQVLRRAAAAAHADGLQSVALTFEPHPLTIVAPDRAPQRLTSLAHKADLILSVGIGAVVCMRFTEAVARLSPREFAERILAGRLSAKRVLVGENFRFGRRQAGDTHTLRSLGSDLGFAVECGGTLAVRGEPVSSTRVRGLLREGLVAQARRLLGRVFCLRGKVVRGKGIGSWGCAAGASSRRSLSIGSSCSSRRAASPSGGRTAAAALRPALRPWRSRDAKSRVPSRWPAAWTCSGRESQMCWLLRASNRALPPSCRGSSMAGDQGEQRHTRSQL